MPLRSSKLSAFLLVTLFTAPALAEPDPPAEPPGASAESPVEPPVAPPVAPPAAPAEPPAPKAPPAASPPPSYAPVPRPVPSPSLYPGWRLEEDVKRSPETLERNWYGWQTLIGLVPSHLLFTAGALSAFSSGWRNGSDIMLYGGMLGHVFSSPIIHWAHGKTGMGFGSLALNVATPTLGFLTILSARSGDLILPLGVVSVLTWPIIDIVAFSSEDPAEAKKDKDVKSALGIHSFGIIPMIEPDRKGLSLVGRF